MCIPTDGVHGFLSLPYILSSISWFFWVFKIFLIIPILTRIRWTLNATNNTAKINPISNLFYVVLGPLGWWPSSSFMVSWLLFDDSSCNLSGLSLLRPCQALVTCGSQAMGSRLWAMTLSPSNHHAEKETGSDKVHMKSHPFLHTCVGEAWLKISLELLNFFACAWLIPSWLLLGLEYFSPSRTLGETSFSVQCYLDHEALFIYLFFFALDAGTGTQACMNATRQPPVEWY